MSSKMPKIEDKAFRNLIINDHYTIYDANQKFEAAVEREKAVILGGYKEDEQKIGELQRELQASAPGEEQRAIARQLLGFKDYEAAVRKFNDKVTELGKAEVKGLKKIDREKFMAEIEKQDFDLSIIEGLYPLFELEDTKEKK